MIRRPPRSTLFPYTTLFRSLLQVFHPHIAQLEARDLLLGALVQPRLDVGHHVVHRLHADRALLARFEDRAAQLLAVEGLAPIVALDHVREHVLDVLVGRVAPVALEALAAPANELAVASDPRVDDAILRMAAERTLHRVPLTWSGRGIGESAPSIPGPRPGRRPRRTRSRGGTARGRSAARSPPSPTLSSRAS